MLEQFIAMVVQAHRDGVSVGVLKAQFLLQGMDSEEVTLLIDIVAIEVRVNRTSTYVQPQQEIQNVL